MNKQQKQFLQILENCKGNIWQASQISGVGRTTVYHWKKRNKKFADEVDKIKEFSISYVESKLMENIEAGKEASIFFYLKTQAGYVEKPDNREGQEGPTEGSLMKWVLMPVKPADQQD